MSYEFEVVQLKENDLDKVIALQEKIIENLLPAEKHHTVHRTKSDFYKALSSETENMFGIFINNALVAQAIVSFPQDGQDRDLSQVGGAFKNSDIAIFKGVLVDPEYRGLGLMSTLIKEREKKAKGKKIALCKISADNYYSWSNAMKNGMKIMKVIKDKDGHTKFLMQKYLDKALEPKYSLSDMKTMSLDFKKTNLKNVAFFFKHMSEAGKVGIWNISQNNVSWVKEEKTFAPFMTNFPMLKKVSRI